MITQKEIIDVLKLEVVPALGCTEPACVALAAANARFLIEGDINQIQVTVSSNIYKNGMSVGIPGSNKEGLDVAAAMGAIGGDHRLALQVLSTVNDQHKNIAYDLVEKGMVKVNVCENSPSVYAEAIVKTELGYAKCIIKDKHSNIALLEVNGEVIFNQEGKETGNSNLYQKIKDCNIIDLKNQIASMNYEDISFMLDGAIMNKEIAKEGLNKNLGMGIGVKMQGAIKDGLFADDLYHNVVLMTAAGADARMSGYMKPVMSSAGSGNHGLTAILPVIIVGEKYNKSREFIAKAIAFSHIVTIYIKQFTGKLSALCGCCVAAATGASAAIAWILDGNDKQIGGAIKNMAANLTGMICDGAKVGCALKVSTAAGAAVLSSFLAVNDIIVPATNGIVADTVEDTIKNMGRVSIPGMIETDKIILDVMVEKNLRKTANCL